MWQTLLVSHPLTLALMIAETVPRRLLWLCEGFLWPSELKRKLRQSGGGQQVLSLKIALKQWLIGISGSLVQFLHPSMEELRTHGAWFPGAPQVPTVVIYWPPFFSFLLSLCFASASWECLWNGLLSFKCLCHVQILVECI